MLEANSHIREHVWKRIDKEITVALYLIFGFNEAKTNTPHLALHIYSNIDLDILQKSSNHRGKIIAESSGQKLVPYTCRN